MTYKGYKIERNEWGYYEATNTNDCDEPIKYNKSIHDLMNEIDEKEL